MDLTLQLYLSGSWHDAATVTLGDAARGHQGAASLSYDLDYFVRFGSQDFAADTPARDARAVSVAAPVDLVDRATSGWPAFLLDLLPQGYARRKLAEALGLNPDALATEVPLLMRGAGGPVGNVRIKEAHEDEQRRIADLPRLGVAMADILARSDRFLEVADYYAMVASGSSGLQGEWPKIAMTQASGGLWYPDPVVPDADARDHVIVKLSRGQARDGLILQAEHHYMALAGRLGVRVHRPADYQFAEGVLVVPRFDRGVGAEGVVRLGQESLVAAAGIAAFGHMDVHETYLTVIRDVSTDPQADVAEYLLRDALNLATGNPDNHGRNTAMSKEIGAVRLSPLFDYAPMRLAENSQGRPTKWGCMRREARDADPDWMVVCEAAAGDVLDARALAMSLASKAPLFARLPDIARECGVPEEVIARAIEAQHRPIAASLARLAAQLEGH